jgi:uncharacterized protein (TIGR03382 family)
MNTIQRTFSAVALAAAALGATSANAALMQCFTGNSMVDTAIATCESFGVVPTGPSLPVTQTAGTATTVGGSAGNFDLVSFGGGTPLSFSNDIVLGSSTSIQYSNNIISGDNYLVLIYETGGFPREWNVVSVTGAELISGFGYAENIPTGTVKFEIYTDPRPPAPVSAPGTLALAGLGLAALGLRRRRA